MRMNKFFIIVTLFVVNSMGVLAQSYNNDRIAFSNFLIRMYNNAPFEGVRAVNDYNDAFLISVLALDKSKYKTDAVLNRVASVKAMANASRYFNGSNTPDFTPDMIIHTTDKTGGTSDAEIIENIREYSVGYVKALEQLTNFTRKDGLQVFIFLTPLSPNGQQDGN